MLEIACRDQRAFYSIPFSGRGQFEIWADSGTNPHDLAEHLTHFYNGGTEPYGPLTAALETVQMVSDELQRADILVITDGLFAEATQTFLETIAQARQHYPIKIALVSVGADNPHAHAFADPVIHVDDLFKDCEQLRGAIATIV